MLAPISSLGRWADEDDDFDFETYVRETAYISARKCDLEMSRFGQVAARRDESAENHGVDSATEIDSTNLELNESTDGETGSVDEKTLFEDANESESDDDKDENEDDEEDNPDDDGEEVCPYRTYPPMASRAPRPYHPDHGVVANMLLYKLANSCWSMDRVSRAAVYEDPTTSTPAEVQTEGTGAESETGETDSHNAPKALVPVPWGPIVWPRWYNHQRWRNIKESMGYPMNRPMSWPSRLHTMELAEETSPTTDSGSPDSSQHDSTGEASTDATSPILEDSTKEPAGLRFHVDEDFVLYPSREIYIDADEAPQTEIRAEEPVIPDNWDDEDEDDGENADFERYTKISDGMPPEITYDVDQQLSTSAELDTDKCTSSIVAEMSSIWHDEDDDFDLEAYKMKPSPPPPNIEELGPLQQQVDSSESAYEVRLPGAKSFVPCDSDSNYESETTVAPEDLESESSNDAHADSTTHDTAADSATVDTTTVVESGNYATETADGEENISKDNMQTNTAPAGPIEKKPEWKVWLRRFKRRGRLGGGDAIHDYILYCRQCINDGEFLERNKYCAIWNDYKKFAGLGPLEVLNPFPLRKEIRLEEAEDIEVEEEEEVVPMPESVKKMGRTQLRARGILSIIDICDEWAQNVSLRSGITVPIQVMDHFGLGQVRLVEELKIELHTAEAAEAAELKTEIVEPTVKEPLEPSSVTETIEAAELDVNVVERTVDEPVELTPTEKIIEVADLSDEIFEHSEHADMDADIIESTKEVITPERTSKKSTRKARMLQKPQSRNRDLETLTFCTKCKTTLLRMQRCSDALHINACAGPAKDASTDDISSIVAKNATHATENVEPRVDSATSSEHSSCPPSPSTQSQPQPQPRASHARLTATTIGLGRAQPVDLSALLVPTVQTSEQDAILGVEVTKRVFPVEKAEPISWIHIPSIFTAGLSLGISIAALGWV